MFRHRADEILRFAQDDTAQDDRAAMKLDDALSGAMLALLGGAILWHVRAFPHIPGQNVGPALFPGVVAAALVVCGALLAASGLRRRRRSGAGAWIASPAWLRSPPQAIAFVVLVAAGVFYLLAVDRLGFVVTAFVCLAALMWSLRVRLAVALLVALAMTLAIHWAFYKLLRVPLPWGVLQGVAW
jgi:putative tricarboxylic transport membrane protein